MHDHETRTAILRLRREGHGTRSIARALKISRTSVKEVLASGEAEVPAMDRPERLGEHLQRVRELHERCAGNLVRVHEELWAEGVEISYPALTAFCRRQGVGHAPKVAAGRYEFMPGEEMQHDTSPHDVVLGGRLFSKVTRASLVLCFSRMIYAQIYRRWTRLECRHFLSEAICALGGAASRCMLDNASVVVVRGTGKGAVMADAMVAFAGHFGFKFAAHELGDANRSARVERPFDYIERNFYPGRTFADEADCNRQLREWCERVNRKAKRGLPGLPCELWLAERPTLRPVPLHVPEVYDVHSRRVDVEGYVNLHRNRYSVPEALIGRQLVIRESLSRLWIYDGHRLVVEHERRLPNEGARVTLHEHRGGARWRRPPRPPSAEEQRLCAWDPALAELCELLKKRHRGGAERALRRLHRIYVEYPTDAVLTAARQAVAFGLCDLGRIETMVLRAIAGDFFRLPLGDEPSMKNEPPEDQGEECVYDLKDREEGAPEPGAGEPGGGPGEPGEPGDHDPTGGARERGGGGPGADGLSVDGDDDVAQGGGDVDDGIDESVDPVADEGDDRGLDFEIVVEEDEPVAADGDDAEPDDDDSDDDHGLG